MKERKLMKKQYVQVLKEMAEAKTIISQTKMTDAKTLGNLVMYAFYSNYSVICEKD